MTNNCFVHIATTTGGLEAPRVTSSRAGRPRRTRRALRLRWVPGTCAHPRWRRPPRRQVFLGGHVVGEQGCVVAPHPKAFL